MLASFHPIFKNKKATVLLIIGLLLACTLLVWGWMRVLPRPFVSKEKPLSEYLTEFAEGISSEQESTENQN